MSNLDIFQYHFFNDTCNLHFISYLVLPLKKMLLLLFPVQHAKHIDENIKQQIPL